MAKKRKLRVGMIGAGGISTVHCKGWTKLPDCELAAVTDIDLAAARRRAKQFQILDDETDARRLLVRKDIDVVDIVVPNRFHRKYAVAALAAGKHVLCEIYYARAWYNRRRGLPTTRGFLLKANSGGGSCIDIGVHVLDLALHFMDNFKPVSVSGLAVTKLARSRQAWSEWDWGYYDKRRLDVEDFAAGLVRFANGAVLSLECSFMLNQAQRVDRRIDLFGTKAGAKWPECEYYSHTSSEYVNTRIVIPQTGRQAHHAEIKAFAEAVMGNKPVPVPPKQSRAVIAILQGLYKSQKLGREVRL